MSKSANRSEIKKLVESAITKVLNEYIDPSTGEEFVGPPAPTPPKPKEVDFPLYYDYEKASKEWESKHGTSGGTSPQTSDPAQSTSFFERPPAERARGPQRDVKHVPASEQNVTNLQYPNAYNLSSEDAEKNFGVGIGYGDVIAHQKAALKQVTDIEKYPTYPAGKTGPTEDIGNLSDALRDYPTIVVANPDEAYGTPDAAQLLKGLTYVGDGKVHLGDVSKKGGGDPGIEHRSHELGTDIDLAYPLVDGSTSLHKPGSHSSTFSHIRANDIHWGNYMSQLRHFARNNVYMVLQGPEIRARTVSEVDKIVARGDMTASEGDYIKRMAQADTGCVAGKCSHDSHNHIRLRKGAQSTAPGMDRPSDTDKPRLSHRRFTENLRASAKKAINKILTEDLKRAKIKEEVKKAIKKVLSEEDAKVNPPVPVKSIDTKDAEAKESPQKTVKSTDTKDVEAKESPQTPVKSKNP